MKKTVIAILVMVLCMGLVACGEGKTDKPEMDVEEYKSLVSACNSDIGEAGIVLSNLGQLEHAYWSSYEQLGGGTIDYGKVFEFGKEQLLKKGEINFADVEADYNEICSQYKTIAAAEISGAEAENIRDNVNTLFADYNGLYLMLTAPSGDITNFADKFNAHINSIQSCNSILSTLVS